MNCHYCKTISYSCDDKYHYFFSGGKYWYLQIYGLKPYNIIGVSAVGFYVTGDGYHDNFYLDLDYSNITNFVVFLKKLKTLKAFI